MLHKRITDPIYEGIKIEDQFIWDLIHTHEMQRLTRIKQLGLVSLLYPSATHTRFAHSLGVYELARRVVVHLKITGYDRDLLLASALLHDIGHGPMSHLFEFVSPVAHEEYSTKIITTDNGNVKKILEAKHKGLSDDVALVLQKKYHKKWIVSILSSQIDIDRLDYLVRDSYYCGLPFGLNNIDFLIDTMQIKDEQLVFEEKAMISLENFVLGRYHMYNNVYTHEKNLGYQSLYVFFFHRLKQLQKENFVFKNKDLYEPILNIFKHKYLDPLSFYKLDDDYIWTCIKLAYLEDDKALQDISTYLLQGELPHIEVKHWTDKVTNHKSEENQTWTFIKLDRSFKTYGAKQKEEAKIITKSGEIKTLKQQSSVIKTISTNINSQKKAYLIELWKK